MKLYKIKKSNIDKRGLCASKDIKEGTKIINYIGKIISKKETEKNTKFNNEKDIYLFNLNNRYDLDGDFKFNTARLINHSCDPNCEVEGVGLKLWISAIKKDILHLLTRKYSFYHDYLLVAFLDQELFDVWVCFVLYRIILSLVFIYKWHQGKWKSLLCH